jgi:nicotinic acid mononucleotide adenylyltransferase
MKNGTVESVGIFGGTFDMPTLHHKQAILDALQFVDVLYVVPCGKTEGKQPEQYPWDRAIMTGLLVAEILAEDKEKKYEGRLRVWTGEVEHSLHVSHTYDTAVEIEKEVGLIGQAVIFIGADLARDFDHWYHSHELRQYPRCVLVHEREGVENIDLLPGMQWMQCIPEKGSSTDLREAIKNGVDVSDDLPVFVYTIIEERGWYGYCRSEIIES